MNMQNSFSEELFINASTVEIDKTGKIVYAKGNVEIYDKNRNTIFSDIAEYDKVKGIVKTGHALETTLILRCVRKVKHALHTKLNRLLRGV